MSEKKRVRQHVIADLSLLHVQYFIVAAGFTSEATVKDYGYDLTVNTFDQNGLIEAGSILIQLKASETLALDGDGQNYIFDLDMRDYNLWKFEPNLVFLILYEASSRRAYWLYFQQYIASDAAPLPKVGGQDRSRQDSGVEQGPYGFLQAFSSLKASRTQAISGSPGTWLTKSGKRSAT